MGLEHLFQISESRCEIPKQFFSEGGAMMNLHSQADPVPSPAHNWPLDSLLWRETFAEIVALLTKAELLVAYLRCQGLDDDEIGLWLDCRPAHVARAMARARRRIERQAPHLAWVLAGRE
jgi:DNA-directed RNA polymerase specialized sigma24 family protein